jgi:hypothetical protein
MASRRRTGDYPGELRQPIGLPDPHYWQRRFSARGPLLRTSQTQAREVAEIERALAGKLPALFAHFGIREDDPDRWRQLALALARKHVPGFGVVHATGAPTKETVELLCRFYRFFIQKKSDRKRSCHSRTVTDAEVCGALSKDEDFKRAFPELNSVSQKRLQNLVAEAKKLRRARVAAALEWSARNRRLGPDAHEDAVFSNLPPWISDRPSALYLKYGEGGPSRRRK